MKNAILFAAVLLLLAAVLCGCMKKAENTDDIDGGVILDDGVDAPKSITSTQITSFSCEFSTLDLMEESTLENSVYVLEATLSDGEVTGSVESYQVQKQTFRAEASFMEQLQQIVSQYDFAGFNGTSYKVSGLPDRYGAELHIRYESGERIDASNNQDCFLPLAAMEELWELFSSQI